MQNGEGAVAKPDGQPTEESDRLRVLTPNDSSYSRQIAGSQPSLLLSVVLHQSVTVLKEQAPFSPTRKYSAAVGDFECVFVCLNLWTEVNISPKISISAQPLKMALHRNPAMHGSRMVIFLHDSKKALFQHD